MDEMVFPYGAAALDEYGRWLGQVLELQASWFATIWALQTSYAAGPWARPQLPPWLLWQPGTEQLA
ncbi:MAG TPA: hypothetical protein VJN44_03295 [Roseateles sp.]|nr:hypothetical protein [Roseateles sp.]